MFITHGSNPKQVDCLILGGGIIGAGVARDAAIRGRSVLLVDSHDFASGTSHLTSKLIHGGLRYLEHGQFKMVYDGIIERDRLMNRIAPNLVEPIRFVIPFERRRFTKWLLTVAGLQVYGLTERIRCGRRSGPLLNTTMRESYPVMRFHPYGVTFWDAQTNDARLVLATLRTAKSCGATLSNYTMIRSAKFDNSGWIVNLHSSSHGFDWTVRAKTIINATGPWSPMTSDLIGAPPMDLMWIKGSHIILRRPKLFGNDAIVISSIKDNRSLWVIPWQHRLIVGSTESEYIGDLRNVRPTSQEVDDLFESFLRFFPISKLTREDICCAYAGVRPIVRQNEESENKLSREHRIIIDHNRNLITITGGKLTTFRRMAEKTLDEMDRLLGETPPTSQIRYRLRNELLWPGLTREQTTQLRNECTIQYNGSAQNLRLVDHLIKHYGHDAIMILNEITEHPVLGEPLFEPLPHCMAELVYLCKHENVGHLIDLVKRRIPLYFLGDHCGMDVLPNVVEHIAPILGWDRDRQAKEIQTIEDELLADHASFTDQTISHFVKKSFAAGAIEA